MSNAATVGAILTRNGTILLGLRAPHKSFADRWDIIGGHIEHGETPWSALCRELIEEIGVDCIEGDLLGTVELQVGNQLSILHVYSITAWGGEPSIQNDEHVELRWFELDVAMTIPDIVTPLYRKLFAIVQG